MFERYTEKARRVIFFARYEASQFGSPFTEPEHLLLGILRDDKEIIRQLVLKVDLETARQEVDSRIKPGTKTIPTNVDLPLSEHLKRVLKYGAEEAERLNHQHIGTAHLLLGLMTEKVFASAEFLSRHGATLESLRKRIEALGEQTLKALGELPARQEEIRRRVKDYLPGVRPSLPAAVEIHGVKRHLEHIQMSVSRCKEYAWHWEQKRWKARDIVIKKDGKGFSFDLALAENSTEFELVKGGWNKDHCAICRWELFESDDPIHVVGFTNGRDWVCTECHQKFIAGNFFATPYTDIT